jgi:hypothetical protein
MKPHVRLLIAFLAVSTSVFGQDQVKDILKGSKEDINYFEGMGQRNKSRVVQYG